MRISTFCVLDSARYGTETRFINHLPEKISNCIVEDKRTSEGNILMF